MAASERFSLLIESQTRGTAEVAKLEEALRKITDVAERAGKKTTDAAKAQSDSLRGHLDSIRSTIQNPLNAAGDAIEGTALKFGKFGLAAAGITVGVTAAAGAVFALANATQDLAEQQTNAALTLGLSIKEYGLFSQASKNAGVDSAALLGTIKGLSKALSENSDEGRKGKQALQDIGVSAQDAFGQMKGTKDLLLSIADGLGRIQSPAERANAAVKILGRGGIELLPVLNDKLRGNIELLNKLGVGFDDISAERANRFGDAVDIMSTKLDVLKQKLGLAAIGVVEFLAPNLLDQPGHEGENRKRVSDERQAAAQKADAERRQRVQDAEELARLQRTGGVLALSPQQLLGPTVGRIGNAAGVTPEQLQAQQKQSAQQKITAFKEAQDLQVKLANAQKDLDEAERNADLVGVKRMTARINAIKQEIKFKEAIEKENIPFFVVKDRIAPENPSTPSLLRGRQRVSPFVPSVTVSDDDINGANSGRDAAIADQQRARAAGINEKIVRDRERGLALAQSEADFEARRIELLAGPGGEVDALNKITALRLSSLNQQKELATDVFSIELERTKVLQDRELKILELKKQQREQARSVGESLFDASIAGGQGIRSLFLSQALAIPRRVSGNLAAELFGGSAGKFQLPGLTGADGKPNFLGKVLQGTPLGIDPLKNATDLNTTATQQNTAALLRASGVSGTSGGGLLGGITGTAQQALGIPGLFAGTGTNGISTAFESAAAQSAGTRNLGLIGLTTGMPINTGTKGGFSLGKGVGYGAAIAGGAYGAYQGFSSGGAQGALTGTGSLAGAAGSILALSGVTGPAAPILAGVGLALGVFSSLLGDPKKKRASAIDNFVSSNQYAEPAAVDIFTDTKGRDLYYNTRGDLSASPKTVVNITNNIAAMDGQDVMRVLENNPDAVGRGVYRAIQNGSEMVPAMSQALGLS